MKHNRNRSSAGHPILDGMASIRRTKASGDYWQFSMWVPEEGRTYRKSLRTTDFESAVEGAKNLCFELHHKVKSGKRLFGMGLGELVSTFVEYKRGDVDGRFITPERLVTIQSYLRPFVRYKGEQTLIGELDRKAAFDYARWRRSDLPSVKDVTIRNEQATINMMMKFAFREGYINFEKFDFAKLRIAEVGRRDTFKDGEMAAFETFTANWAYGADAQVRDERMTIYNCLKFSADSMLRVGEIRQLRWKDVIGFSEHADEANIEICLVELRIRAETSKTRKSRTITTRGGYVLKEMRKRLADYNPEHFVFCGRSGAEPLSEKKCNAAWSQIMVGIGLDYKSRGVTWYSLRHFGITRLLRLGVSIYIIAEIAGTSVEFIQRHYGHMDQEMSKKAALKTELTAMNFLDAELSEDELREFYGIHYPDD